jgi:hypothetical protein
VYILDRWAVYTVSYCARGREWTSQKETAGQSRTGNGIPVNAGNGFYRHTESALVIQILSAFLNWISARFCCMVFCWCTRFCSVLKRVSIDNKKDVVFRGKTSCCICTMCRWGDRLCLKTKLFCSSLIVYCNSDRNKPPVFSSTSCINATQRVPRHDVFVVWRHRFRRK